MKAELKILKRQKHAVRISLKKLRRKRILKRRNQKPSQDNRKITTPRRLRRALISSEIKVRKQRGKRPIKLEAPANFSLLENTDEVLNFFKIARDYLMKGKSVFFDIENIGHITPESIALLSASVNDVNFVSYGNVGGNIPKFPDVKKKLSESGFFDHVKLNGAKPKKINSMLLHIKSAKRVQETTARDLCIFGINHVFTNFFKFQPLYEIFIECMQNTTNHAGLNTRSLYDWWVFAYNDTISNTTHFTFLDLGVGIFQSLPMKNYKKIARFAGISRNVDLVDDLFAGKIKSRTMEPDRGKGIPQIKYLAEGTNFLKFVLISNDVYTDLKSGNSHSLNQNFKGTLFYWELEGDKNRQS